MKRRDFNLLAGSSIAAAGVLPNAQAQSATQDPSLLTTTLTPMGGERAGNADGSIPPWMGGVVAPTQWDVLFDNNMFAGEKPLYTVDQSNMAQYADMLTAATKVQIQKWGMSINVYQTHRTAAAPQWVYDNIAKNVARAKLDPAGGRLGFTGAYGGAPFPIPDISDPYAAGAQLIWNHLTAWAGIQTVNQFGPNFVIENGSAPILASGGTTAILFPYYDPHGSPETYDGYLEKLHQSYHAPPNINGQELLIWHSSNTTLKPDITWSLLNGEARVRKAPDEAFDCPNSGINGIGNIDENTVFYGSPQQYDWKFIEKKEMLIPYNNNGMIFVNWQDMLTQHFPNPKYVRWEKHRMWVVEATLHPGYRNVNSRRTIYIDEDSWFALLGDGYDADGNLWKGYGYLNRCVPILPGTVQTTVMVYNLMTGDYAWEGTLDYTGYKSAETAHIFPPSEFDPDQWPPIPVFRAKCRLTRVAGAMATRA